MSGSAETASIQVEREFGGVVDHLRAYRVVIDGSIVGGVGPGVAVSFEVSPGPHEVFLKLDWCRSDKFNVHLAAGEIASFHCAPRSNLITGFYWAFIGFRRYIKLARLT